MKRLNQKGAIDLPLVILIILVLVVGSFILYTMNVAEEPEPLDYPVVTGQEAQEIDEEVEEEADPNKSKIMKSLESVGMTFYVPDDWKDTSDITKFKNTDYTYSEVVVESPDGFVLSISANNVPKGFGGIEEELLLEKVDINSPTNENASYKIVRNTDGKIRSIFVGSGDELVGETTLPIGILSTNSTGNNGEQINILVSGGFFDGTQYRTFDSLEAFNSEPSVIQAKEILKSIQYSNS